MNEKEKREYFKKNPQKRSFQYIAATITKRGGEKKVIRNWNQKTGEQLYVDFKKEKDNFLKKNNAKKTIN